MMGMGDMPYMYNLVVNTNNPLISKIMDEKDEAQRNALIKRGKDLALLAQNLLHGEELTNFVEEQFSRLN